MKNFTEEQKKQFYETYGRFCVSFESMVQQASLAPLIGLKTKGLFDAHLSRTLLEGTSDTAKPRIDKYRAIVNILLKEHKEVKGPVDKVFLLVIDKLIPIRNDIIHGVWSIESTMSTITEVIPSVRNSINKEGYYWKEKGKSIEEIKKWEVIINECTHFFANLWAYFIHISMKLEYETNFELVERQRKIEELIKSAKKK